MSKPSTPNPSSLSDRLRANQAEVQQQLAEQTQKLLQQHDETLKKLCADARRSTRRALQEHRSELDTVHQQMLARMRWLLLWPIATIVVATVVLVTGAAAWTAHRLQQVRDAQTALDQASTSADQAAALQQATQQRQPQAQFTTARKHR